jgi:hypothetical protein
MMYLAGVRREKGEGRRGRGKGEGRREKGEGRRERPGGERRSSTRDDQELTSGLVLGILPCPPGPPQSRKFRDILPNF